MESKRFILAVLLSAAILFTWQYFFAPALDQPTNPSQSNSNDSQPAPVTSTPFRDQPQIVSAPSSAAENIPQRNIIVESPLYKVTFDSRGAVPTSWIIKKNKQSGKEIYSVGANISQRMPLELISQKGLEASPREAPLKLLTGDASLDSVLNERNYTLEASGVNGDFINLAEGEQRRLTFVLRDEQSGVAATKTFEFSGGDYTSKLETNVTRGGAALPQVELSIGPSIGDQGIHQYSFYSVAPEAVKASDGEAERYTAVSISDNEATPGNLIVGESAQWAAIADTYFAMAVVPTQPFNRVRFRTTKYEHEYQGDKEDRFLVSGFVPVPANGLNTFLFVGPKDHYLLTSASGYINSSFNTAIDLDGLIDYGFLSDISRPLAIPILYAIKNLQDITGSYGIAIVLFTIIIYSLFFPLKWRSSKAMKKAQKLAPRMKEVQEKIKNLKPNDPRLKELQMEQLRLMKEGNMLGGCLPLLIQMPFFFALYRAITISLDFRQATFLWLPDLSASDPLHLLPFLMAGSILVVQLITPAPTADPLQRKMMAFVVPAVMLYALWSAPAGLLLYWFVGNVVTFGQQMLINQLVKSEDDQEPPHTNAARQVLAAG